MSTESLVCPVCGNTVLPDRAPWFCTCSDDCEETLAREEAHELDQVPENLITPEKYDLIQQFICWYTPLYYD